MGRIRVGQAVEVTVDSLAQRLPGHVVAIDRATAATFSLLLQGNPSGNSTKVTQLVPVKIAVDFGERPVMPAMTVAVNTLRPAARRPFR